MANDVQTAVPSVPRPLVRTNNWVTLGFLALAWMTQVPWFAAVPLVYCGLGAASGWNPLIAAARPLLRKPASAYVPEEKAQLRFNQTLLVLMLAAALISHAAGWETGYYVFTILPALANIGAIAGFCVGCFIRYRWMQYRHARTRTSHPS